MGAEGPTSDATDPTRPSRLLTVATSTSNWLSRLPEPLLVLMAVVTVLGALAGLFLVFTFRAPIWHGVQFMVIRLAFVVAFAALVSFLVWAIRRVRSNRRAAAAAQDEALLSVQRSARRLCWQLRKAKLAPSRGRATSSCATLRLYGSSVGQQSPTRKPDRPPERCTLLPCVSCSPPSSARLKSRLAASTPSIPFQVSCALSPRQQPPHMYFVWMIAKSPRRMSAARFAPIIGRWMWDSRVQPAGIFRRM